jgi:hypothetical protein
VNTFRKLRAFCRVLKGAHWHLDIGAIRTRVEGQDLQFCPLTYVFFVKEGESLGLGEYRRAADDMGLTDYSQYIAESADGETQDDWEIHRQFRRILKKACGVK